MISYESKNSENPSDLFGFLLEMNQNQVNHVIHNEEVGIVALILAQVSGEISSSILQKMDAHHRSAILVAMGSIDLIPLTVYREIAERLALKGAEIKDMSKTASDGVDSILAVIETLPLDLQFQYIHSISETNLELGRKLRSRYITLHEIPSLPDAFLAAILQSVEKETILKILYHAESALKTKVLDNLSDSVKTAVVAELAKPKEISKKDSVEAQKYLLKCIRKEVTLSGRPVQEEV